MLITNARQAIGLADIANTHPPIHKECSLKYLNIVLLSTTSTCITSMGFHKLLPSSVFTYLYRELTEIAISKSKLFPNTSSYDILCRCWSRTVYLCLWKMYGGFSLHIICCLGVVYFLFWTKLFYFYLFPSSFTVFQVLAPWQK